MEHNGCLHYKVMTACPRLLESCWYPVNEKPEAKSFVKLPLCHVQSPHRHSQHRRSTSGTKVLGGSFASLSLELLSLSESEELSESLVLPDSALLECADATLSGCDCGALKSNWEIKLESSHG